MAVPSCTSLGRAPPPSFGTKPRDGRVAAHPRNGRSPGSLLLAGWTLGRILAGTGTSAGRALGRDTARCRRQGGGARRDLGSGRIDLFRERALWRHQPRFSGRRRRHGDHAARQGRRREEPPVARDPAGGQGFGLRGSDGPVVGRGADRAQAARHRRAPCPHPRWNQPSLRPDGTSRLRAGAALFAAPFDLERLVVTGQPVETARDVFIETSGAVDAAFASSGLLVYVPRARSRAAAS